MKITYSKLTEKELDTFIQMRIRQLREEGAKEKIDLAPALKDYYERHMADGTFVSWLALDGEMLSGELPVRQRRILDGWMALHEEEAYAAWNLAVQGKAFEKIIAAM